METVAEISIQPNGYILIDRGRGIRPYKPTATSRRRLDQVLATCPQMTNGRYFYRKEPVLRGRNFLVKEATGLMQEIMSVQVLGAFNSKGWLVIRLLCVAIRVAISNECEVRLWLRANGHLV